MLTRTSPVSGCGLMRTISFRALRAAVFIAGRKAVSSLADDNAASLRITDTFGLNGSRLAVGAGRRAAHSMLAVKLRFGRDIGRGANLKSS
jgi:hypothetical protein